MRFFGLSFLLEYNPSRPLNISLQPFHDFYIICKVCDFPTESVRGFEPQKRLKIPECAGINSPLPNPLVPPLSHTRPLQNEDPKSGKYPFNYAQLFGNFRVT
jgi:hypothetical protein